MNKRNILSIVVYILILSVAFGLLLNLFSDDRGSVTYSQAVELLRSGAVKHFIIQDQELIMQLHPEYENGATVVAIISDAESFLREMEPEISQLRQAGRLTYELRKDSQFSPYSLILPLILVGIVVVVFWVMLMSRASAGAGGGGVASGFGKARTVLGVPDGKKVTFDDVAGADEEKAELQEVVDFLRDPQKYTAIGARIPHGLLLVGPPGTGKTLLARAVAGEAGVQFLSISGSDFVELYVGVGASRVRDLFDQAKKMAPAIIFIDEIDAVGRRRGSGLGGGHDEKEQTLNQLLVEMDGFGRTQGVIVLAATNRPDILDPALLRPGRFDRQIHVGAPDVKGREDILKVHAKNKRLDDSVDMKLVARSTSGFTGADLSNLLNEAAIMAARENKPAISMQHLNDAMMKIMAGPEKRSRVLTRKDLKVTALHEAGHAVAMYHLPTQEKVLQITIVPRGRSLGATWHLPADDTSNLTRNQMYEEIVSLLGGRVAEALFVGDVSVGASNDIDRASKLARDMVARYGMCERLGTVSYLSDDEVFIGRDFEKTKGYSEKVAATIDDEVKALVDRAYDHCARLLKENEDKVQAITDFLLERETMNAAQFEACMRGEAIPEDDGTLTMFREEE